MRIARLEISNFRAIHRATVYPEQHNALLGPNNVGKTALLEALHLLLSPELTGRTTAIDENDFFGRNYRPAGEEDAPIVQIRAVITGLSADDEDVFHDVLVPWNAATRTVVERTDEGTDPFVFSPEGRLRTESHHQLLLVASPQVSAAYREFRGAGIPYP